ncbi:MAG: ribosome maturation factor RimP [Eubacteriaceae bacterium]|nr:ribosome maturation factor RimP [Eubacteriaceae bacterium]MDD4508199.1 ribosome maturation factor RimP [Eubacteriaceae bacterium]
MAKKSKKIFLFDLLSPEIEKIGYECYDLEFEKKSQNWVLTIYIDKKTGVSLEDCEKVSHVVSNFLDEKDPIEPNYILDVSSPGLERKLKRKKHFKDNIGKTIDVNLFKPVNETKKICGCLVEANEDNITIECEESKLKIAYCDISKASLHFEF